MEKLTRNVNGKPETVKVSGAKAAKMKAKGWKSADEPKPKNKRSKKTNADKA